MQLQDFACFYNGIVKANLTPAYAQAILPIAIHKKIQEQNKAILLLHGFSSSPAVFRLLLPFLNDYDGIEVPLLPGHGESIEIFSMLQGTQLLQFVEEKYEALRKKYETVDVLGLSLGGLLAHHLNTCFTLHHLYLLAPAFDLYINQKTVHLISWLNYLGFHSVRSFAGNLHDTPHCEIAYRQLPLKTLQEVLHLIQSYIFKPVQCPTDLFLGSYDQVIHSERVAQRFAGCPHTTVHWLKQSAHVLPLDSDITQIQSVFTRK